MEIFFGAFFVLFFCIFFVILFKGIAGWHKNNKSPRLTVPAVVVAKRASTAHHHHHHNHVVSTNYYATFQFESGDRMELAVNGSEYGMIAEGDSGRLTFQGTRYLNFERCAENL